MSIHTFRENQGARVPPATRVATLRRIAISLFTPQNGRTWLTPPQARTISRNFSLGITITESLC